MAPRRARGGRGRGGSSGPAAPPSETEPDQAFDQLSGPSFTAHRDKSNTTPENIPNEDDSMDVDPNDSPATQPTETPASTPIRPLPALQMQSTGGSGGVALRGGTRGIAKESKFKPKNIRRSASELQAFADQERDRVAAAASNAARSRGREYASRGRAGRGRGDAMGRGRGTMGGVASGPFAVMPDISRRGGLLAPGSGIKREDVTSTRRTTGASGPNVKSEGRPAKTETASKSYHEDPQYPDEDGSLPRIDIQNINLVSSDEVDEDDEPLSPTPGYTPKGKSPAGSNRGGLKPVRLDRHEHKERTSQVNTAPTIKGMPADDTRDSDTPMVDEERSTRMDRGPQKRVFKGAYVDGDVRVKDEPVEPMGVMDQLLPGPQASRSATEPKFRRYEIDTDEGEEIIEDEPAKKQKKKIHSKKKGTKFVIQTEEDRGEWERHMEDLDVLKEELGGMQQDTTGKGKGKEVDVAENAADKRAGRLYLFQFPPAMPKLFNPATMPKPDPAVSTEAGNLDIQVTGSRDKKVVDLDKVIKPEEEEIIKKEDDAPPKKTRESLAAEQGYVGKLIVRESGRVELDWGGSRMLVGRGIETSFLSMGVLVDSKGCFDTEGRPTGQGVATGMGQIMGKFVVTPDWESMVEDIERAERRERRK